MKRFPLALGRVSGETSAALLQLHYHQFCSTATTDPIILWGHRFYCVLLKECDLWVKTRARLRSWGRPSSVRRMHVSRNAQRLGNGFDRLRNSGPSASLSWFASNMLMRQRGPFLALLVATQVTYGWQQTRGVLFRHILPFHPRHQHGKLHGNNRGFFYLVNGWFLLGLLWASHLVRPYLWSVHGHIAACWVCVRAAGVVSLTHLHFNVSRWFFLLLPNPLGFQHILCNVALPCLLKNSNVCPPRKWSLHPFPSVFSTKTPAPLPTINNHPGERRSAVD